MHPTASFDLHGVMLGVSADHSLIRDALASRLAPFAVDAVADHDVSFAFRTVGESALADTPPTGGRPVFDTPGGPVVYSPHGDELFVDDGGRVQLRCQPATGVVDVSGRRVDPETVWLAAQPLFTIALTEVLKRRGLYSLHAGCVATDEEHGIVLPGASGAGKSTLVVGLVREGFGFLSDDLVFLADCANGVEVHAFPDRVDVTATTVALFPELGAPVAQPGRPDSGRLKSAVRIEDVFTTTILSWCTPRALVFPSVAHADRSVLSPLSADEALLELVPNVLLTDNVSSQAHLDAIGSLVRLTPNWRLETGRDFGRVAAMLRELVG